MPTLISTNGQTSWKNCYASSSEARLNLRVNGEEKGIVISGTTVVDAGFNAPTTAPTATATGAGNVPAGYYWYAYVYASSKYPYVPNAITGGGAEYPRSNPSPFVSYNNGSARSVDVVVTPSQRGDVDYIWVYRTATMATAALALAESDAGRFYYVDSISNDPTAATSTLTDNNASDTGESLELDNFTCPLFRFTVFDGTYWWGFGGLDFTTTATLDGTSTISISSGEWYSGRNGLTAKLTGIDTGGFDAKGTFYFKATGLTTAQLFTESDLSGTATTLTQTGTATIRIITPRATLYRSKALNPFSWGRTTQQISADGEDVSFVSDTWAEVVGGGTGTAIALIPNERVLKLDTESPVRSYALDLNSAESDLFMGTLRTLDESQSVSSHFSQFAMRLKSRQSISTGINSKGLQILNADASSQVPIGDNVIRTLRNLRTASSAAHFYHGVFDYRLELNCWFVKTTDAASGDGPWKCDTLLYQHAPTGEWGLKYWPALSASAGIYDSTTGKHYTLVADEFGRIGFAFTEDVYRDFTTSSKATAAVAVTGGAATFTFSGTTVSITTITTTTAGVSTVVCGAAHGRAVGDEIFIGGTNGATKGNYIVATVQSSTIFTVAEKNPTGVSSAESGGSFLPAIFYEIPGVIIEASSAGTKIWVVSYAVVASATYNSGPQTMSVAFTSMEGINLDNGEKEAIESTSASFYPGATAALIGRFFNAGEPSRGKRPEEAWATITGVDDAGIHRWRWHAQYDEDISFDAAQNHNIAPEKDTSQTFGVTSQLWFTRALPEIIYASYGLDFCEIGYSNYTLMDFTLKAHAA